MSPTPIIQGMHLPHPPKSPPLHMTKTATESSDSVNLCRIYRIVLEPLD